MKYCNSSKFNVAIGVLFVAGLTLRANDFGFAVEGHITGYDIQGAPDLGIAVGDHFAGTFHYLDGHYDVNSDGSIRGDHYLYDQFLATIEIHGITFRTHGTAGNTGGDFLLGGGLAVMESPNVDYSLYFPTIYLDTVKMGFFEPYLFRIDGSGGPSSLSPNGSSLNISGEVDSTAAFDFTAPDPVRTDALLVLVVAALLVAHAMLKRRLAVARQSRNQSPEKAATYSFFKYYRGAGEVHGLKEGCKVQLLGAHKEEKRKTIESAPHP